MTQHGFRGSTRRKTSCHVPHPATCGVVGQRLALPVKLKPGDFLQVSISDRPAASGTGRYTASNTRFSTRAPHVGSRLMLRVPNEIEVCRVTQVRIGVGADPCPAGA